MQYWIGIKNLKAVEVFMSSTSPTVSTVKGKYSGVMGPFKTKRAALIMAKEGDRSGWRFARSKVNPCGTRSNPSRLEEEAMRVGSSRELLRKRLNFTKSVLTDEYRRRFRPGKFDFAGKRLVSDDGRCFLQWQLRQYPNKPISPYNQQTSQGAVVVRVLSGATRSNPRKGRKVSTSRYDLDMAKRGYTFAVDTYNENAAQTESTVYFKSKSDIRPFFRKHKEYEPVEVYPLPTDW